MDSTTINQALTFGGAERLIYCSWYQVKSTKAHEITNLNDANNLRHACIYKVLIEREGSKFVLTSYYFGYTCQQVDKLDSEFLSSEFLTFVLSTSVLGQDVILDQEPQAYPAEHVRAVSRFCNNHLLQLRGMFPALSSSPTATLVHTCTFIANCLDYWSYLYCRLPQVRLQPLNGVLGDYGQAYGRLVHNH